MEAVVEEWRDGELVGRYGEDATKPNSDAWVMKGVRGGGATARRRGWWQDVLLPEGYPESVSGDYATYQTWDTVQALCSSITGLLCTRALLQGVGVGDVGATPGAAAVQWALRDGAGMGSELDNNAKTWRLMADILNDIGMTLELLSPLFPAYFFALACAGSFCKAIVGVAGGATRAAITMHQARADNMADVAAKDGSQETAVTLVGLILGLIIAPLVDENYFLIWLLFAVFTTAHLFANYRAVRGLVMDTLNRQRLAIVVTHYLGSASREVLSPVQASAREWPLWFAFMDRGHPIRLGTSLAALHPRLRLPSDIALSGLTVRCAYLTCVCTSGGAALLLTPPAERSTDNQQQLYGDEECSLAGRPSIEVLLRQDADHGVMIEAFASALVARRTLGELQDQACQPGAQPLTLRRLAAALQSEQSRLLPPLVAALSTTGWHTTRSLFGPGLEQQTARQTRPMLGDHFPTFFRGMRGIWVDICPIFSASTLTVVRVELALRVLAGVFCSCCTVRHGSSSSSSSSNSYSSITKMQTQRVASRMGKLGTETAFAVSLEAAKVAETGKKVYPFHIGDLDFASPDFVVQSMNKAIADGKTGYCAGAGILPLRKRLAEVLGEQRGVTYGPEHISVQSGGKPVITKFFSSVMEVGDEVLYPSPGYPIYESQIQYLGGVLKPYTYIEKEDGFALDLDGLRSQITSKTKVLVYNNYQNPMGIASSDEEMAEIAKIAIEHDLLVLSDEAYFNILYDGVKGKSIVSLPGMYDRTVILYTYSKSWAMTGWRLGAAVGPQWIINLINKLNTNDESCTTHFIQWAGIECLTKEGEKYTAEVVSKLQERRDVLVEAMRKVPGFKCHSPPAAFYLFVNVTEAMEKLGLTNYEEFRRNILDATGVAFCTREHFGASLPGETQKYVRFAYSGIGLKDIQEACEQLKNFMEKVYKSETSTA